MMRVGCGLDASEAKQTTLAEADRSAGVVLAEQVFEGNLRSNEQTEALRSRFFLATGEQCRDGESPLMRHWYEWVGTTGINITSAKEGGTTQ